jgi:hypothetical protein
MDDQTTKKTMLEIAANCERLARQIESRRKSTTG